MLYLVLTRQLAHNSVSHQIHISNPPITRPPPQYPLPYFRHKGGGGGTLCLICCWGRQDMGMGAAYTASIDWPQVETPRLPGRP